MRSTVLGLLVAGAFVSAAHAQEVDPPDVPGLSSTYTKLEIGDDCIRISSGTMGGEFSCPGLGGYGVTFAEGDLRTSIFYGHLGDWYADGAWESFGAFNSVGDTLEWRLNDDVPFATILRWFIEDGMTGDEDKRSEVLVVSKIGQPGAGEACVVGYVDAKLNSDANVIARQVADEIAPDFTCRTDEPEFHGQQSESTPWPTRSFGL